MVTGSQGDTPEDPPRDEEGGDSPRSELRRPSPLPWIALALVALAAALAALHWLRAQPESPGQSASASQPDAGSAAQPPASPSTAAAAPAVDPLTVNALLAPVSTHPLFRRWLAEGDLVRRWVVVTDNLAEGVTPRKQLGALALPRPFSTVDHGGQTFMSPESYQRYDEFAEALSSIDAQALARAYRELHGVLDAAYRALGYPDGSIDRATARALKRIEATPVRDGEVALVPKGLLFAFAEPDLEVLSAVEKNLLRMGPRNTRLLQSKAREIREALKLPAVNVAADGGRGR